MKIYYEFEAIHKYDKEDSETLTITSHDSHVVGVSVRIGDFETILSKNEFQKIYESFMN